MHKYDVGTQKTQIIRLCYSFLVLNQFPDSYQYALCFSSADITDYWLLSAKQRDWGASRSLIGWWGQHQHNPYTIQIWNLYIFGLVCTHYITSSIRLQVIIWTTDGLIIDAFMWHSALMSQCRARCTNILSNTLRPRQNGRQFPDDNFKCIF